MTLSLVSTITVGAGGAASIEFTGIPQTGTDLYLVFSIRTSRGSLDLMGAQLNGDTTSGNYVVRWLRGDGSSSSSDTRSTFSGIYAGIAADSSQTANTFSNQSLYFPNYTASTTKTVSETSVDENNGTTAYMGISANSWSGTAAISSIKLLSLNASTLLQYSTASLYTITKGSGGATVA